MTLRELSGYKFQQKMSNNEIHTYSVEYKDETILDYRDPDPHYILKNVDNDSLMSIIPVYYDRDPIIVQLLIDTYYYGKQTK